MWQKFFFCVLAYAPCALAAEEAQDVGSQMLMLDKQIQDYTQARNETKLKADIAGRNADRIMAEDWMQYRHELERQKQMQEMVRDMDAKIAELQAKKAQLEASKH